MADRFNTRGRTASSNRDLRELYEELAGTSLFTTGTSEAQMTSSSSSTTFYGSTWTTGTEVDAALAQVYDQPLLVSANKGPSPTKNKSPNKGKSPAKGKKTPTVSPTFSPTQTAMPTPAPPGECTREPYVEPASCQTATCYSDFTALTAEIDRQLALPAAVNGIKTVEVNICSDATIVWPRLGYLDVITWSDFDAQSGNKLHFNLGCCGGTNCVIDGAGRSGPTMFSFYTGAIASISGIKFQNIENLGNQGEIVFMNFGAILKLDHVQVIDSTSSVSGIVFQVMLSSSLRISSPENY